MVLPVGVVVPRLLGIGRTLLTAPSSVVVCLALFLVGGWDLARDIWLEGTLARSQAQVARLARTAEQAQLLALRSHLDPHFLFNTLNAIAEWCREDGEVAEEAVLQLAAILRAVLDGVRAPVWPLRDELALIDSFFALHALRDPDRLRVTRRAPEPLPDLAVPPMLLLPLAENAVKHGVAAGQGGQSTWPRSAADMPSRSRARRRASCASGSACADDHSRGAGDRWPAKSTARAVALARCRHDSNSRDDAPVVGLAAVRPDPTGGGGHGSGQRGTLSVGAVPGPVRQGRPPVRVWPPGDSAGPPVPSMIKLQPNREVRRRRSG